MSKGNIYTAIFLANVFLVLGQNSFFNELLGNYLNPNLVLAFAFSILMIRDSEYSFFSAFLGGLFIDLSSMGILGISPVFFTFVILISYIIRKYFSRVPVLHMTLFFVYAVFYKYLMNFGGDFDLLKSLAGSGTSIIAVGLFYLLNRYLALRYSSGEYKVN